MAKEDFVRFKDSGGAFLIVDKVVAVEYGYKEGSHEVDRHLLEAIRNRQKEHNEQKAARRIRRAAKPDSRLIGRVRHSLDVAVLQRSNDDQKVRREDDLQSLSGAEVGGHDLEGGQSVLPLSPVQGGGEAGDSYLPGVVSTWSLGGDSDSCGTPFSVGEALANLHSFTFHFPLCWPRGQEGLDDNQNFSQ
jgi:hypothetical protein